MRRTLQLALLTTLCLAVAPSALAMYGNQCRNDGDCASDRACLEGFCVVVCNDDGPCASAQHCLRGGCLPDFIECIDYQDCGSGEVCHRGACLEPECYEDYHCPTDVQCLDHFCQVPGSSTDAGSTGSDAIGGVNVTEFKEELKDKYLSCSGAARGASPMLALAVLVGVAFLVLWRRRRATTSGR